jgi:hypothetical protein
MASSSTPPSRGDREAEVEHLMRTGTSLARVEDAIDKIELPEDEKAGLWLLGWSLLDSPKTTHEELQQRLAVG